MNHTERLAMVRASHLRYLSRARHADRFLPTIAPHLRAADAAHAPQPAAFEELATPTVRVRGVA